MTQATTTGSTVPRRQLGRHLRDLRNRSRLTVRAAAQHLEWSEAKIWRIETGQVALRGLDVETMCRIYGASRELTRALMGLAKETKARGWWHAYGDVIPAGFDVYVGLEEAATQFSWYESELVPGLLQTEEYARALIRSTHPHDENEVQRLVSLKMARQALLTRVTAPPRLDVALNEAVLRRPIGGNAIMAGQLNWIAEAASLSHLSLRIVPFDAGLHRGVLSGPFVILRFPTNGNGEDTEPPTVYVDGFTGELYLDKPHEVASYATAFENIWESTLDEQASQELIRQVARELRA